MYLSGNDSVASILLGSTDFFDMLMKLELIERVADHDNAVIDNLIALKNEYEATKLQYETDKTSLEATKQEYETNLTNLNGLYDESAAMIAFKKSQEIQYINMTAEQKKAEEEAEKALEAKIREEQMKNNAVFNGAFLWPLPNYSYISSYFGWRTLYGKPDYHRGIDISGSYVYGKPIVASAAGKVIIAFTNDIPGYSYGKYVVIDHGTFNGIKYSTVYGHASKLAVKVGDYVKGGQTIAYVGSTGSSTGAHLHFEIREDGERINPLKYLKR